MKRVVIAVFICSFIAAQLPVNFVIAHKINPKVVEYLTGETISYDHHAQPGTPSSEADPRIESRTFYSFPEWYIVYSAQEYGNFIQQGGRPSQFPYFHAIGQMWSSWEYSSLLAEDVPDSTTNTILWTIAISFSIEYGLIGIYENTIGRLSEWLHFGRQTKEDQYIEEQAVTYGNFLNQVPWYDFPYLATLSGLWKTWGWSSITPRGIERKVAYTIGYGGKAIYAAVIRGLSEASFEGGAGQVTYATVQANETIIASTGLASTKIADTVFELEFPRYRAFTEPAVSFAQDGGEFLQIQGHSVIAVSVTTMSDTKCPVLSETQSYKMPLVTDPNIIRYMLSLEVQELSTHIKSLTQCDLEIEHIYDY